MAKRTIRTRLPRKELRRFLLNLPGMLSGTKPSQFGLHRLFWGAIAYSLFTSIHDGYDVKSMGLPDELGNEWDDLDPRYKAYKRPVIKGEVAAKFIRRSKTSPLGLLSPGEYSRWRVIFGTIYHSYKNKMQDSEAKALAGQIAWTRLKDQGAPTKLKVFGERSVSIMRKTDALYLSLEPGEFNETTGYRKKRSTQVFKIERGKLTIGTNIPYAVHHDKTRPVWPEELGRWLDDAVSFAHEVIYQRISQILQ